MEPSDDSAGTNIDSERRSCYGAVNSDLPYCGVSMSCGWKRSFETGTEMQKFSASGTSR